MPIDDHTIVFHGTTLTSWQGSRSTNTSLYVTTERHEAEKYATEQAEREEGEDAIVCVVSIRALKKLGLQFAPDDGCQFLPPDASWETSVSECGSFRVDGFNDAMKPIFTKELPTTP